MWTAKRIAAIKEKRVGMTPYQDALIGRGLRPYPDPEDMMDPTKDVLMGYSAALVVECLEEVGNLEDRLIWKRGLPRTPRMR